MSAQPAAVIGTVPRKRPSPGNPYARSRRPLGDPTPLACTVAKTALEVVMGGSGIETLTRWVSPAVREGLAMQHSLARRASRFPTHPATIARIRVFRVHAKAAEVSIVAHDGDRNRAIAMRLEDTSGRWQATVLEVV